MLQEKEIQYMQENYLNMV